VLEALAEAARTGAFVPSEQPEERRSLEALEEVALRGTEAPGAVLDLAREALEAAGVRSERIEAACFRLLRRLGRFASDDENLEILRYRLRTRFPEEVLDAARAASERSLETRGRSDLTHLDVLTIDGAGTREIDDGLSIESLPGGVRRVGVHIADPSAFVLPGDPIDTEALSRGVTHYFPERRIPMLPESISEEAASLLPERDRPALSFLVEIGAGGAVVGQSILRSVIRSRAGLDYDEVDARLADGTGPHASALAELLAAAGLRESARIAGGALALHFPEVEIRVEAGGRIVVERRDSHSSSHRLVAEAMLLAGAAAAAFCSARKLPAIYRRQAPPDRPIPSPPEGADLLASAWSARRSLRRGEIGLEPGSHFGLGLPAYAQVTSPLRRFQDLALHRQIAAALEEKPPPYDAAALQRIAASTERAELDGRRAERAVDRYWLLRHLEAKIGEIVPALVVEDEPRPIVILVDTMIEEPVRGLSAPIGSTVRLRIERVDPRADVLRLRPE
jgi:exoribonuclease-2